MVSLFDIYVLNLAIVVGMFLVTIYRAWIEKKQLRAKQKIEVIETILEREKDLIKELSGEEFIDMLNVILD